MNTPVSNNIQVSTEFEEYLKFTHAQKITVGVVLSTITLITIIGNFLIITFFVIDKNLRSKVSNLFLLNLAISDFLVGVISMPISTSWILHNYWPYGEGFCKAYLVIDYVACFESVLSITLISLDRFLLVKLELRYSAIFTKNRALLLIVASWLVAILLYAPIILSWSAITGEKKIDYSQECEIELVTHLAYNITTVVIELALPFIIITGLNMTVYYDIRKRSRSLVPAKRPNWIAAHADSGNLNLENTAISTKSESNDISSPSSSKIKNEESNKMPHVVLSASYRRANRAAKSLFLIVSVFFVCWFPYNIYALTVIICDNCYNEHIWDAVNYILWFNSGLNPFLYAICNRSIRNNFKKLIFCSNMGRTNISAM